MTSFGTGSDPLRYKSAALGRRRERRMVPSAESSVKGALEGFSPNMQVNLRSAWRIGRVEIPTRLVLAPMAGVSVQAFRRQGRRYGAGLVCSEMVSCAGLN